MEEVQSYRNKIKQLEDDLLFRLSNSQARICVFKLAGSAAPHMNVQPLLAARSGSAASTKNPRSRL